MCWCDPQKRTPICDDCPPERKAEWARYSDSMPKCPYCGEQATCRERNTYYCSKTHYWQEDASKVYASLEAQRAARPEIPAGNAEALEKAREAQIEAFIASHVADPNYRTTADYIRGFMREEYRPTQTKEIARYKAALEWYAENARLCRLIHKEGDVGRNALAADGGKIAREALTSEVKAK